MSVFQEQSEVAPMVTTADTSNAPTCTSEVASFAPGEGIKEDNQYLVYQGERIVSFREMLRRYQYHNSYWPAGTGTGVRMVAQDLSNFPYYRGWDPNGQDQGVDSTAGNSPYTFCTMTLLNYLTPAFACRRGALRHKAIISGKSISNDMGSFHVARHNLLGISNGTYSHPLDNALLGDRRSEMQETQRSTLGGAHLTPTINNPCLEYETPFYTLGQRFVPGRDLDYYAGFHDGHELTTEVYGASQTHMRIDKYISIGKTSSWECLLEHQFCTHTTILRLRSSCFVLYIYIFVKYLGHS
jgi:hypothetical protein